MDKSVKNIVDNFFRQFKFHSYKKGEILIRADDDPSGIFYIKNGIVKEYAISKKGEELVVNLFKESAFFPMSFAINKTPNRYFFEAVTPLDVYKAPKEKVVAFIKENPQVLYDLLSRVFKGTDGLLTRMTYLMSGNAYTRLITELVIYAKRFGTDQSTVTVSISEKDLAAQSGMTRETVSREMKIKKDKGLVIHTNHVLIITDVQKLELELADGV